jgi:hypothetical protein
MRREYTSISLGILRISGGKYCGILLCSSLKMRSTCAGDLIENNMAAKDAAMRTIRTII